MMNNENGRSMVEMLGVLAIIGVLSVAGIAGYTVAMRKHRANEIAQAVSTTAILAKTANGGRGITSASTYEVLAGVSSTPSNATIEAQTSGSAFSGVVNVKTGDEELCKALQGIIGTDEGNPIRVTTTCSSTGELNVTVK